MGVWEEYTDLKKRLIDLIISTPPTRLKAVGRMVGKTYTTASTIADHLIANGVIILPCKMGDTIYRVCSAKGTHKRPYIKQYKVTLVNYGSVMEKFGKTVFLTYEEAERVANGREKAD